MDEDKKKELTKKEFIQLFARSMSILTEQQPVTELLVDVMAELGAILANLIFKERKDK